jgi:hypothetical protein
MRNVTLAQLRLDIQNQSDIAGLTQRHGATLLNRLINQSVQRFREKLSGEGSRHFLSYATGTISAGATSGFPFKELNVHPVASGLVRAYGLDIKTQGGSWKRLEHTTFEDRANYGGPISTDEPSVWAEYQTTKLAILPCPDRDYDYLLWYLPARADMTADSDTFDGVAGWEDFIKWDVSTALVVRDQYPNAYQMFIAERQAAWSDILRTATRVTGAGGATIGRDSMGNKDMPGRGRRYLPRP